MASGSHGFEDDGRPGGAAFALAAARDAERRMRQVKAMVRLGAALRAEKGLERICTQVVEAVSGSTGFRVAALNLVRPDSDFLEVVATTGLSAENERELLARPPRLPELAAGMQERFRRSRSYFIPHQERQVVEAAGGVVEPTREPATGAPDEWDPEDVLLTPLVSPRTERLIGLLSLDQPEDQRIPTLETIEIIELFTDQAALAIDTSRIFAERAQERRMLDEGLALLRERLERARNRDLSQPAPPLSVGLAPLASSLDEVLLTLNDVLLELRAASEVVNQHATEARAGATYLASGAQDQAERILELSHVIEGMTDNVRQIAATAEDSSALAQVASEVSRDGSQAAELAAEGMLRVRELTLQTTRKVKRLGETVQDIGMIVRVVEDFAAMTNVLALNASIEAARAGEHGRGFAVVAHEVRNLANHSAEATRQIHTRIEAVQSETGEVARQIESGAEQVVLQSELVSQAGAALEAVDSHTQRVATAIQQISDIAVEQAGVAEQVIAAIRELAAISTEASDGMEQARASMDYLVDLAWALQEQIAQFRLREDEAQASAWGAPSTRRLPEVAPLMGLLHPVELTAVEGPALPGSIADEALDAADQPTVIIAPQSAAPGELVESVEKTPGGPGATAVGPPPFSPAWRTRALRAGRAIGATRRFRAFRVAGAARAR
jgi:methyl-accepting chemotaxis protein